MSEVSLPVTENTAEKPQDIQKLAGEAGISLAGKIGGRVVNLGGEIALARLMGPAVFGFYALGVTLLRLVGTLAALGLPNGVIWFGTKFWPKDEANLRGVVRRVFIAAGLSGLITGFIFFVGAPWVADLYQKPEMVVVIRWISLAFPFITLLRTGSAATRISQKLIYSTLAEDLLQPLVDVFLIFVLYFLGYRLVGALAAGVISFAAGMGLALYYAYRLFFRGKSSPAGVGVAYGELLKYSLPTAFTGFLGQANSWVDRLLVGFYLTAAQVGIYQSASQSSMFFTIILNALYSIIAPMIADLHHKGEKERLAELYRVGIKWGFYLGLPFFLTILFGAEEIMAGIFGSRYASGAMPMIILNIGQLANLATGSVGYIMIMTGRQKAWLGLTLAALITNITGNTLLTPQFGLIGAAIAASLAVGIQNLSGLLYVRRVIGLWPYDRRFIKGILAAAATAVFLWLIKMVSFPNPLLEVVVFVGGAYLVFGAALLALRLDREDREIFALFKTKLRR